MTTAPTIDALCYGSPARLSSGPATLLSSSSMLTGLSAESVHVRYMTMEVARSYLIPISVQLPIAYEFAARATEWKAATKFFSSPEMAASHPAYQRIIGMGWAVVPHILNEMATTPGLWFEALMAITDAQPIPIEHAGDIDAMTADWLAWGRDNGVLAN